jgi:phytoene synthase
MVLRKDTPTRAHARSSFFYAFLFLPRVEREALEAVYAFCRAVDDVVDGEGSHEAKQRGLARWRELLDAAWRGAAPPDPVAAALERALERFPIRRADLEAIIDGCAMDLERSRYRTFAELYGYCYRVASSGGLACIEIFGYATPGARAYAVDLGMALQLTNILRDVGEDAARGRIYVPTDELAAFGVDEETLTLGRRTPALERLLAHQAARARTYFARARAAIGPAERRGLVVAEIMGDIYAALLEEIVASGFDVWSRRVSLPARKKALIAGARYIGDRVWPRT